MAAAPERIDALDALRAGGMILVLAGHALGSFTVTPIGWAIQDRSRTIAADLAAWILRAFLMPLFFAMSGLLARRIAARRGLGGFARERARRLLLPFALLVVPTSLLLDALWDLGAAASGGHHDVAALRGSGLPLTLGHLWFVWYLLLLSAIAIPAAALLRRAPAVERTIARLPPPVWIVPTALLLCFARRLQPDTSLSPIPDPVLLLHCGTFFAFGVWLEPRLDALSRWWAPSLALAAALLAALIPALRAPEPSIAASGAAAAFSWLLVWAAFGAAVRFGSRPIPLVRRLSDGAFTAYVVHLPLVVGLQLLLAGAEWPGIVKYALVLGAALPCLWLRSALDGARAGAPAT